MVVIAYIPLLAAVAGALVYGLASNPKLSELGRLLFLAACIAFLFAMGNAVVKVG